MQQIFGHRPIPNVALTQGHEMPCKAIVKLLLRLTLTRFQTINQCQFLHCLGCDSLYKRARVVNTASKGEKNHKKSFTFACSIRAYVRL